jgi:nitrate reductase gamma subunit
LNSIRVREASMQVLYYLVLVPMVYLSFSVFILGTIVRLLKIFREPPNPIKLQIFPEKRPKWLWAVYDTFLFPTVLKHRPALWFFLILFHVSFILLVIGHLELIRNFNIFQIIPHEPFLGRGFVGLILSISLLYFLFRRFSSPVKDLSVPEDYYLLILLFLSVIFGSEMDWARRWYGFDSISVDNYREYLFSLLILKPKLPNEIITSGHSFMLVLHVFFGNLFLIFFPFSQAMHSFFSLPMNKLKRG